MSSKEINENPAFRSMVRANGQAEVWTNTTDDFKLKQYGWRCTTNENSYELETLMGNWLEERSDIEQLKLPESLPSQYGHYFNSMYNSTYNTAPVKKVPEALKGLIGRYPHAYPRHQPELDSEEMKMLYNSWKTTYRSDYLDPRLRTRPVVIVAKAEVPPPAGPPGLANRPPILKS